MKRTIFSVILCIVALASGRAQSITPEFELRLHYSDPGGGGGTSLGPIGFGYDPAALDITNDTMALGIDSSAFGMRRRPLFGQSGGFFIGFPINDQDASLINIRHKPDSTSFRLSYRFSVSPFEFPGKLKWDPTTIPPIIDSIIVAPASDPSVKMIDMVRQDSVLISNDLSDPNFYENWSNALITIYYNTQAAAVMDEPAAPSELLGNLTTYPNPMRTSGTLSFTLSEQAHALVSLYDMTGRLIFQTEKNCNSGLQQISLSSIPNVHGAALLRVDAESEHGTETKSTMIVLE